MSSPQMPKPLGKEERNRISNKYPPNNMRENNRSLEGTSTKHIPPPASRVNMQNTTTRDSQGNTRIPRPAKPAPRRNPPSVGSNSVVDQSRRSVNEHNTNVDTQPRIPQRTIPPPRQGSTEKPSRIPRPRAPPIPNNNIRSDHCPPHHSNRTIHHPVTLRGAPKPPVNKPTNFVKSDAEKEQYPPASTNRHQNMAVPTRKSMNESDPRKQNSYDETRHSLFRHATEEDEIIEISEIIEPNQVSCTQIKNEAPPNIQMCQSVAETDNLGRKDLYPRISSISNNSFTAENQRKEMSVPNIPGTPLQDTTIQRRNPPEVPIRSSHTLLPSQKINQSMSSEDVVFSNEPKAASQDNIKTIEKADDSSRFEKAETGDAAISRNSSVRSSLRFPKNRSESEISQDAKQQSKAGSSFFSIGSKSSKQTSKKTFSPAPKDDRKSRKSKDKRASERHDRLQAFDLAPIIYDGSFANRYSWPLEVVPSPPPFPKTSSSHKSKDAKKKNKN